MTDAELVARTLAGEHASFNALVERHYAAAYALCLSRLRLRQDAEDAAQEAFIKAYTRLDQLRKPAGFASWLAQIARTTALSQGRTLGRRAELHARFEEDPAMAPHAAEAHDAGRYERLHALLAELPEKTREAVSLFYLEQYTAAEIARYLDTTERAVKRLLQYGRQKLRRELEREFTRERGALRPRSEAVAAVCASLPLGQAPWSMPQTTPGAPGASAAPTTPALSLPTLNPIALGGLLMNAKHFTAAVALMLAVAGGLFWWNHVRLASGTAPPENVDAQTTQAASSAAHKAMPLDPDSTLPDAEAANASSEGDAPPIVPRAQDSATTTNEAPAEPFIVYGQVRRLELPRGAPMAQQHHFKPLSGVTLVACCESAGGNVEGLRYYRTTTDAHGNYRFEMPASQATVDFALESREYMLYEEFTRGSPLSSRISIPKVMQVRPGELERDFRAIPISAFIKGRVVDSQGKPIEGAAARILSAEHEAMPVDAFPPGFPHLTGHDGRFAIPVYHPEIRSQAGGFSMDHPAVRDLSEQRPRTIRVQALGYGAAVAQGVRAGVPERTIVLAKAGAIEGVVLDTRGNPAAGAKLILLTLAKPAGGLSQDKTRTMRAEDVRVAETDAEGGFRFDGLSTTLDLALAAVDRAAYQARIERSLDLSRYPSVRERQEILGELVWEGLARKDDSAIRGLAVEPERTTGNVRLELSNDAVVRGRVLGRMSRKPLAEMMIRARPPAYLKHVFADSHRQMSARSAADGSFMLRLPALRSGPWTLKAGPTDAELIENPSAEVLVPLSPGAEVELDLLAHEPARLDVAVHAPEELPPNSYVAVRIYVPGPTSPNAFRKKGVHWPPGAKRQVFSFDDLTHEGPVYARAEWKSGKRLGASRTVEVAEGKKSFAELTLRGKGGVAARVVRPDGKPAARRQVWFRVPVASELNLDVEACRPVISDADGRVRCENSLIEGRYPEVYAGVADGPAYYLAIVKDIELGPDAVTDFGTVKLEEVTKAEYETYFPQDLVSILG